MSTPSQACPTCEQGALFGITDHTRSKGGLSHSQSTLCKSDHQPQGPSWGPSFKTASMEPVSSGAPPSPQHPPKKNHWKTPSHAKERSPSLYQRQAPSVSRGTSPGSRAWCPLAKPTSWWPVLWGTSTVLATSPTPLRHSSPSPQAWTPQNLSHSHSLHLDLRETDTHSTRDTLIPWGQTRH